MLLVAVLLSCCFLLLLLLVGGCNFAVLQVVGCSVVVFAGCGVADC